MFLVSCSSNEINPISNSSNTNKEMEKKDVMISISKEDSLLLVQNSEGLFKTNNKLKRLKNEIRLKYAAQAIAILQKDPQIKKLIKNNIAKKFDGDFDCLWDSLKNYRINNNSIRKKFSKLFKKSNVLNVEEIEKIGKRFNISIPVHFEDFNENDNYLVAYVPQLKNDVEVDTLIAFDGNLNVYKISGGKTPNKPIIVVGLNERVDNNGVLRYKENLSLKKTDASYTKKVYMGDMYFVKDYDPWFMGKMEVKALIVTDADLGMDWYREGIVWNSANHFDEFLFPWIPQFRGLLAIKFYEIDDWDFDMSVKVQLNYESKYGSVHTEAGFELDKDDDYIGYNEIVSCWRSFDDFQVAGGARFKLNIKTIQ